MCIYIHIYIHDIDLLDQWIPVFPNVEKRLPAEAASISTPGRPGASPCEPGIDCLISGLAMDYTIDITYTYTYIYIYTYIYTCM